MATHFIPKNLKGEGRILIIFSTHSLITTGVGIGIGAIIFMALKSAGMTPLGVILLAILGLLGFAVGTFKIPRITGLKFTKNVAGDSIDEIIIRYIKFKSNNRKIYTYTKEEK